MKKIELKYKIFKINNVAASHYDFTKPPTMKGNSFICMTIERKDIHDILTHLVEYKVKVYDFHETDKLDPFGLKNSFTKAKNAIYGPGNSKIIIYRILI